MIELRAAARLSFCLCVAVLAFSGARPAAQVAEVHAKALSPMAWIAGQWLGHQGPAAPAGADVLMDVRWAPNGQALFMDLTVMRAAAAEPFMSATYYWHPGTKTITMWQILSPGTVNDGRVITASEAGLTQELRATEPNGATRLLRTEFVHDDPNQFTFKSSSRATSGDAWIAAAPVRFVRKR